MEPGLRRHFVAKDPLLTRRSERRLTLLALGWLALAIAWGHLVQALGWRFEDCAFCIWLAQHVPSIHTLSVGHRDPNAMRFVMVFNVLAAPVFLFLLFRYVNEWRRLNLKWWGYPFFLCSGLIAVYVATVGLEFGGVDAAGFLMECHYKSLLCSAASGVASWALALVTFHLLYYTTVVRIFQVTRRS
jgi:hypothetical protein